MKLKSTNIKVDAYAPRGRVNPCNWHDLNNYELADFSQRRIISLAVNDNTGSPTTEPTVIIGKKLFDNLMLKYGFSSNNAAINAQYDANNTNPKK